MGFRRKTLSSPRLRRKKRQVFLRQASLLLLAIVLFIVGARILLSSSALAIKAVAVSGVEGMDEKEIKAFAFSELSQSRSNFFSRDNFIFFDKEAFSRALLKAFPKYASVKAELANVSSISIDVSLRETFAFWCYKDNDESCLNVDYLGVGFQGKTDGQDEARVKIFSEKKPIAGELVFSSAKFGNLADLIKTFARAGRSVKIVYERGEDFYLILEDGAEIRLSSSCDANSIVSKVSAIYADWEKEKSGIGIDYIDLRYGNKVFIKKK